MIKRIIVTLLVLAMASAMLVSCDMSGLDVFVDSYLEASSGIFVTNEAVITTPATEEETTTEKENDEAKLNGLTPYEVYSQFNEKLASLADNCTIVTVSDVNSMIMIPNSDPVISTNYIEIIGKTNGDNAYYKSTVRTALLGKTIETVTETWYVDGVLYTQKDGKNIQMNITKEQVKGIVYGEDKNSEGIIDIPKSWFNDVSFESQEDGTYIMNIDMSGNRLSSAIKRLGITSQSLEISDIKFAYRVDSDGMIISAGGDYTMELGGSTESNLEYSASGIGTIDTKYSNFGTTEEITLPANADKYVEVTYEQVFGNK